MDFVVQPWQVQPVDADGLIGRTLGGTYRIDRRLGEGGMGAVYAAAHARTGRGYAVKVLLPEVAVRRDALARFRREADAVGALGHANIVAIHDFHEDEGLAYLVMDLLEGEDLSARLDRQGALTLRDALGIFGQIAAGLEAAHARGLVHRDLKPANVFLARQPGAPERAVLLDFGLAKSFAREGDLAKITASGVVIGTPQYMSPEQAAGRPVDARADLYALAAILYEMLTGSPPLTAPTLPALFAKLVSDPPPPLSGARPDLPAGLSDVLERALAKDPADRYPDARALAGAIDRALEGIPSTGEHPVLPRTIVREMGSAPVVLPAASGERSGPARFVWLAVVLALGAFAAAGAIVAAVIFFEGVEESPPPAIALVPVVPEPARSEVEIADEPPSMVEVVPEPVVAPAEPLPVHRPRVARAEPAPPAAPVTPPPQPPSGPADGPRPGVRETADFMGVRDWRGCIRSTHQAPRSPEILSMRMTCSLQAHDANELRATCAELRQHYPTHGYTRTCEQLASTPGAI